MITINTYQFSWFKECIIAEVLIFMFSNQSRRSEAAKRERREKNRDRDRDGRGRKREVRIV
jgi:hypothetical protein